MEEAVKRMRKLVDTAAAAISHQPSALPQTGSLTADG